MLHQRLVYLGTYQMTTANDGLKMQIGARTRKSGSSLCRVTSSATADELGESRAEAG